MKDLKKSTLIKDPKNAIFKDLKMCLINCPKRCLNQRSKKNTLIKSLKKVP